MYVSDVVHGENDSRLEDTVRVVRRRHLDEATRAGESNEIDDRQAGMALTKAEQFEPTAACSGGACNRMAKTLSPGTGMAASDDSKLTEVEKPDTTAAAASSSVVDEETSQSQYYYEYVGPTKSFPGEAKRASSRGRSLVPTEPNTAQPPQQQQTDATQHQTRKAGNSEMEDILDGFVKLLNGQPAQPSYRQPIKTRINNRGPPRIAEAPVPMEPPTFVPMPQHQQLPPSPPPQVKPKDPPPYPFDMPHSVRPLPPQPPNIVRPFLTGVPLPEQLVPTIGGDHVDDDDLGPPSLYDHQSTVANAVSRRPVYQTAKPQQEYDLFASHAHGGNGATTVENVTEKFTTPLSPSPPPPSLQSPPTTQPEKTTEKPTSTDKPSTPPPVQPISDINATRVIGLQVSKIVDHLTSPAMPVVGRENSTTIASTTTTSTTKTNSMSTEPSATTPTRPDMTLQTGEQVTGVGSAVVVLEPSTSEEPHHEEAHKPTENKLPSGKPTTPIKKTPQQSGNYESHYNQ